MATIDRRLDALTSELTARERAALSLSSWRQAERPDDRLDRYCPPHDRPEFDRITQAVEQANNHLHRTLAYILEWVANIETEIHWLRTLEMYAVREKAIPSSISKTLPALPKVWPTDRTIMRSMGTETKLDEEEPRTWPAFVQRLSREIERNLQLRWQDHLQCEAALTAASEAVGIDVTHVDVREVLDGLRDGVLGLQKVMVANGYRVELPEFDPAVESFATKVFDMEAIGGKSDDPRKRMSAAQSAELEAWEQEQADRLRNRS